MPSSNLPLLTVVTAVVILALPRPVRAVSQPDQARRPAEESRLNTALFREGLKKRGLTELLELHIKDFPPRDKTETLLMTRDVELARFADPTRPKPKRLAAIAEANRILEQLLNDYPEDPRRFDWRFSLAHSLIYDEAEPYFSSVLYRGGSRADRESLLARTTRAVGLVTSLLGQLEVEYRRVDNLPIGEFERLEKAGYIGQIDRLGPRAEYLLLWALFYDSLPREDDHPTRARNLNRILDSFTDKRAILETPHDTTRVQVQALVLAGMTHRLLNHHPAAREHLEYALTIADRIDDQAEHDRVQWAVRLARIELIRNDRDDGRFDAALDRLVHFRELVAAQDGSNFGLRVVAALLERSVFQGRAATAEKAGESAAAQRYRDEAWMPLARLAERHPNRRDELYATVYDMIDADADPFDLDPFEQCALIAGLLSEASEAPETADSMLDRAVRVGTQFLSNADGRTAALVPQVLYNVAVAEFQRGRIAQAAARFLEVARDHTSSEHALQAATYAAQLASELHADPALQEHPEIQQLYVDALDVLVTGYTDTEAARYWRFYYAQLLDELERYDDAAVQYALVHAGHEHYLDSLFFRVRSLARALRDQSTVSPLDPLVFQQRVDAFFALQRDFVTRIGAEVTRRPEATRTVTPQDFIGRARLLAAEVHVLPGVDRPARALETLSEFEGTYPGAAGLAGRVWRVRLLAYEKLGRLDEAARAIPTYIAADPDNAGPTLQSLYISISEDVEELRAAGDDSAAQRKADVALVLAGQINEWAGRYTDDAALPGRGILTVQLAEANLHAGRYEDARELFESGLPPGKVSAVPARPIDLRATIGYAESLFQLDEHAAALPRFNVLAAQLPPADPIRWKALLRDLQCRAALEHPPEDIVKVIRQQKFLYPDLGGPNLAARFEKLERESQRRADGG